MIRRLRGHMDAQSRGKMCCPWNSAFVLIALSKGRGLRRLKLHGIKRQKVPKIHGLKKHQKNHSLACKKSSRFWNTKRTLM